LPEGVIGRVAHDLAGETYLFETVQPRHIAGRARAQPGVVVVVVIGPPREIAAAGGLLVMKIGQAVETERAVVEPIIAPPAIGHRIDGNRGAQRRVRVHQRHERCEAVV